MLWRLLLMLPLLLSRQQGVAVQWQCWPVEVNLPLLLSRQQWKVLRPCITRTSRPS